MPPRAHELPTVVPDGAGGAIVAWYDIRSGINVYAQRLNAAGVRQWPDSGVALCTAGGVFFYGGEPGPAIVSDGAGGAIVTWYDNRVGGPNGFDIYAQRVNAAGATLWGDDGVALCDDTSAQYSPTIASDGAGGAIVTWLDYRNADSDIYAQRVDAAGTPQWTDDGVALCTVLGAQYNPMIASDGAGGAIVTWYDYRGPSIDIYAQRVSAAGAAQWIGGVALCTNENNQYYPLIVSDGAGGAIVAWTDDRNTYPIHSIYAQRVNSAGATHWTPDGVALQAVTSNQRAAIVADGEGGAIVTWQDYRGTELDIYAQRVGADGALQWAAQSVALCTAGNNQWNPAIASDGAGGAVVTWWDDRSGVPYPADIYAQRVNEAGAPEWTAGGVALCTVDNQQAYPTIASDGAGGAIVAWQDSRGGPYAQRVYGSGGIVAVPPGSAPAGFLLLALSPNPSRDGQLTIRFNLPTSGRVSAEVFDLAGHRVRTLATDREFSPGPQALDWDGRNDMGVRLSSGVYFVQVRDGTHSGARRAILLH